MPTLTVSLEKCTRVLCDMCPKVMKYTTTWKSRDRSTLNSGMTFLVCQICNTTEIITFLNMTVYFLKETWLCYYNMIYGTSFWPLHYCNCGTSLTVRALSLSLCVAKKRKTLNCLLNLLYVTVKHNTYTCS